jgi:hypothetical protein
MRVAVASTALSRALVACSQNLPAVTQGQLARAQCPARTSGDFYFPADTLGVDSATDGRIRLGVSRLLGDLAQPSLSCGAQPQELEAYRLIWIHAFSHAQPIVITVKQVDGTWSLSALRTRGAVDHSLAERRERVMSTQERDLLSEAIDGSRFWQTDRIVTEVQGASDGAAWVLEGRRGTGCHVVARLGQSRR